MGQALALEPARARKKRIASVSRRPVSCSLVCVAIVFICGAGLVTLLKRVVPHQRHVSKAPRDSPPCQHEDTNRMDGAHRLYQNMQQLFDIPTPPRRYLREPCPNLPKQSLERIALKRRTACAVRFSRLLSVAVAVECRTDALVDWPLRIP